MKKKARVHRLPTKSIAGSVWQNRSTDNLFPDILNVAKNTIYYGFHLYITTDEEIKEGDWFINTGSGGHPTPKVYQANSENSKAFKEFGPYPEIRKIIATTDPKLGKIGYESGKLYGVQGIEVTKFEDRRLPTIPQSFIEEYCKVGGIDEVLVEYYSKLGEKFKGVVFTEEELKYDPKLDSNNCIIIHPVEEKMYSREEVIKLCEDAFAEGGFEDCTFDKWIEENL